MTNNFKILSTADYAAVAAAMQPYVDGMRNGDTAEIGGAFHPDAQMYGAYQGHMYGGPIHAMYPMIERLGAAPRIEARIDVLAMTPTTAVVRLDIEQDAAGASYTEFHTLVKTDGGWKSVLKSYHAYAG